MPHKTVLAKPPAARKLLVLQWDLNVWNLVAWVQARTGSRRAVSVSIRATAFPSPFDDCEIETITRKNALNVPDVAEGLNQAAFGPKADTQDHASD
jgi:hypothetical protein